MDKQMKTKLGLVAVVLVAGLAVMLVNPTGSKVKMPSRSELYNQCMNSAFDYVDKQNPKYCECFADNYPVTMKQIIDAQGKSSEEISQMLSARQDPMAKCEPLKVRDFQKEAAAQKQQMLDMCLKNQMGGPQQSPEECECFARKTEQEMLTMLANKDLPPEQRKPPVAIDCAIPATKQAPTQPMITAPQSYQMPDHLEFKDENGKLTTITLPNQ